MGDPRVASGAVVGHPPPPPSPPVDELDAFEVVDVFEVVDAFADDACELVTLELPCVLEPEVTPVELASPPAPPTPIVSSPQAATPMVNPTKAPTRHTVFVLIRAA